MNYFKEVKSMEELKQQYRQLAKKYHPDVGGTDEDMRAINAEYDALKEKLKGSEQESEEADLFRQAVESIINLNVEIEVCGRWIWVSGETRPHKETLKQSGYRWAPKKKMWYWAPSQDRRRRRPRTNTPMEQIRQKYGSQKVEKAKMKAIR